MLARRGVLAGALAAPLLRLAPAIAADAPGGGRLTDGAVPITPAERLARIGKVQALMRRQGIAALLIESGASLTYFTGVRWWRSERVTAAVIPADGAAVLVTPYFEAPTVAKSLAVPADIRTWNEDEGPFGRIAAAVPKGGRLAVEATTRQFIVEGLMGAFEVVSGKGLVDACRQIKSPAELALMRVANAVTLAALREVHAAVRPGMTAREVSALMAAATARLGGTSEFAMVLIDAASAEPHGRGGGETVREGSTILMDCGCSVHDYQSDISRTWVVGAASARQRKVWETVRRGQEVLYAAAKPGVLAAALDAAVRRFYVAEGWGPGFALPGLSHRAGHGIGIEGHESPYLVGGDVTPLVPGMCFSNEPGLYIPGEFGVRLEDCWVMGEAGAEPFTPLAKSLDAPI